MKKIILSIFVSVTPMLSFGQEILECPNNKVTIRKIDVSCFSGNDGEIAIESSAPEVKGFKLINNTDNKVVRDFTTDIEFGFLTSGSYRIICQDTIGNLCYSDVIIKQPEELKLTTEQIVTSNRPSKDKKDGSITVNFTGGETPHTLYINNLDKSLDTSFTSKIIDNLNYGIYTIKIKDKNGCETKGIQYELPEEGNFNYHFHPKEITCVDAAEYKINVTAGERPFQITVSKNGTSTSSEKLDQNSFDYNVPLNGFGNYDVTIEDKRKNPVKFPFQHNDIDCNLNVSISQTSHPNLDNLTNGKIRIVIQNGVNGSSPYSVKCIDNQTNLTHSEAKISTTNHEFSNLKEGSYKIIIEDAKGRKFDTLISIVATIISGDAAKTEFEQRKNNLIEKLNTCECHKEKLENTQMGFRITIAVVGLAGTISTAGIGTLFGGIVSGVLTTGGMLTNEFAPNKKLDFLKLRFEKLSEIKKLYDNYPLTNFNAANWNTQKADEYEKFKKHILGEESKLKSDFTPKCNPKRLNKYSSH
jgi:hypothetical protein